MELQTPITDYFAWLATAGGGGVAVSFVLERVPQFQLLSKNQKQLVSFALVVLVVIAANSFPQLWRAVPVYQQSAIVSFIDLLFRSGLVVGAVELFHKMTKQ